MSYLLRIGLLAAALVGGATFASAQAPMVPPTAPPVEVVPPPPPDEEGRSVDVLPDPALPESEEDEAPPEPDVPPR